MSTPTSPVKRVSSRTPKLSAKMIALEEEVNLKRRKTLEAAKSVPATTTATTTTTTTTPGSTAVAATATTTTTTGGGGTGHHHLQQRQQPAAIPVNETNTASPAATGSCNTSATVIASPIYSSSSPSAAAASTPPKPKAKGAAWNSGQSSTPRNRKRKSRSSGNNSTSPRRNTKNSSTNTVVAKAGVASIPTIPVTSEHCEKDVPCQTGSLRLSMANSSRIAISSKSAGVTQQQAHRSGAPSCSSGSGGMYEESSELDVTQFTPSADGGGAGGGCGSSQQVVVVDETSESTISMMSLGVTSGSPGLPATPVSRTGGGGKESKKKKSSSTGKKLQENNAREDEAEEKWLMAIEAGKLEEDAELRSMKDPALMTARQRAVVEAKQARVEHLQHIQALHEAWKDQAAAELLSTEVIEKRAQKAAKRRRLAEEKRDKEKKDTIKRLLKKADSRQKTKKLQRSKAQMVAKVRYRYTYEGMTVSFPVETPPASLGIDLTPKKAQYPTAVLCSNVGCANLKRYQCSSNGLPVCSLQCYRQVSLLPPLAQLLESAATGSQGATPASDTPVKATTVDTPSEVDASTVAPIEAV